jgi:hypothetical protein
MPRNQPFEFPPQQLQSLLVHWVMVAAGEQMPQKADFRVRSLTRWRDNVAIVSPAAQGDHKRYLFHKVGEALTPRFGRAMMLRSVHALPYALREPLRAVLARVRMNCAPVFAKMEGPADGGTPNGTNVTWCDLVLPLYDGVMPGGRLIFASYPLEEEEMDSRGDAETRSSCQVSGSEARV